MPSDPKPLSAKEITKAKALCEKATPGPWKARSRHCDNPTDSPAFGEQSGLGWDIEGPPEPQLRGQFSSGYDAHFIAAARTGWPRALVDLERARELLKQSYLFPIYDTGCRFCGARLKQGQIHEERCLGEIVRAHLASAEGGE